jgi:hypothetical protein
MDAGPGSMENARPNGVPGNAEMELMKKMQQFMLQQQQQQMQQQMQAAQRRRQCQGQLHVPASADPLPRHQALPPKLQSNMASAVGTGWESRQHAGGEDVTMAHCTRMQQQQQQQHSPSRRELRHAAHKQQEQMAMLMQNFLEASQRDDPEARRLFTSAAFDHSQEQTVFDLLAQLEAHGTSAPSQQSRGQGDGDVAADASNIIWPNSRSCAPSNQTGRDAHVTSPFAAPPSCREGCGDNVHRQDYQVTLLIFRSCQMRSAEAYASPVLLRGSWQSPQQRQGYCWTRRLQTVSLMRANCRRCLQTKMGVIGHFRQVLLNAACRLKLCRGGGEVVAAADIEAYLPAVVLGLVTSPRAHCCMGAVPRNA